MTEIPSAPAPLQNLQPHIDEGSWAAQLRRHGPWILLLVLVGLGVVVVGSINQEKGVAAKLQDTRVLEECLDLIFRDPPAARKRLEEYLPQMQDSPLRPWFEFLAVKSHVMEAQRDHVALGKNPEPALALLDTFIQGHVEHPEVTAFAWLNKAALLEDLGRHEESAKAYAQLSQYPNSAAHRMSGAFAAAPNRSDREKMWTAHLETLRP